MNNTELSRTNLIGQFLISKEDQIEGNDWENVRIGRFTLSYHKKLGLYEKTDCTNGQQLYILGYFRFAEELCFKNGFDVNEFINELYLILYGRYIIITVDGNNLTIYLDPGGTLSLVFSERYCCVGSTVSILLREKEYKNKIESNENEKRRSLILSLTEHTNVNRLLPNHSLDLSTFEIKRCHFFRKGNGNLLSTTENYKKIGSTLQEYVKLFSTEVLYMTLTAGADNRIMLAAAKDNINRIRFFTNHKSRAYDLQISKAIARRFGLTHLLLKHTEATTAETEYLKYLMGISYSTRDTSYVPGHLNYIPSSSFQMTGGLGEIGKGMYYRDAPSKASLDIQSIVRRMRLKPTPVIEKELDTWLGGIDRDEFNQFQILDLLYLENDSATRSGPILYLLDAYAPTPLHIFNHINIIWPTIYLPVEHKLDYNYAGELVYRLWPELNTFPINSYLDLRRYYIHIQSKLKIYYRNLRYG